MSVFIVVPVCPVFQSFMPCVLQSHVLDMLLLSGAHAAAWLGEELFPGENGVNGQ